MQETIYKGRIIRANSCQSRAGWLPQATVVPVSKPLRGKTCYPTKEMADAAAVSMAKGWIDAVR